MPFLTLIFLFTVVPIMELMLLFRVGGVIGAGPTLGIVLLTGILGAWMSRSQGRDTLRRIQETTARGKVPTNDLIGAFLIFGGGLLLLTPGFITDILGLSFVFPLTRWMWVQMIKSNFQSVIVSSGNPGGSGGFSFYYSSKGPRPVRPQAEPAIGHEHDFDAPKEYRDHFSSGRVIDVDSDSQEKN